MFIKTGLQLKKRWLGVGVLVAALWVKYYFSPTRKLNALAKKFNSFEVVGGYC